MAAFAAGRVALFGLAGEEVVASFEIRWSVAQDTAFEGFDIERSASASGPWTQVNAATLAGSARSYIDTVAAGTWYYRVVAVQGAAREYLGPLQAEVAGRPGAAGPRLLSPAPNPFRVSASVPFVIGVSGGAESDVGIFDVRGRRVATLYHGAAAVGRHELHWDGRAADGRTAPSGLYFARLQ